VVVPARECPGREAILHLHGGWFNLGSAQAFRNLVGHIAARTGVDAFLPDYRLAPEHPFPAATEDVRACYLGLIERGFSKVAITGDSAGGNLALGLLSFATAQKASGGLLPVAAVCFLRSRSDAYRSELGDARRGRSLFHPFAGSRAHTLLSARPLPG
jgi:epsilon-lactone hydrolase